MWRVKVEKKKAQTGFVKMVLKELRLKVDSATKENNQLVFVK